MPGPRPTEVVLTDEERHDLERLVCGHKTGQALVRRARVVLVRPLGTATWTSPDWCRCTKKRLGCGDGGGLPAVR